MQDNTFVDFELDDQLDLTNKFLLWVDIQGDRHLHVLMNEFSLDLKSDRYMKKKTPNAFMFGNKPQRTFDVFHEDEQYIQLAHESIVEQKLNLTRLMKIAHALKTKSVSPPTLKVLREFSTAEFKNELRDTQSLLKSEASKNQLISKYDKKLYDKMNKFLKLRSVIYTLRFVLSLNKSQICRDLNISRYFLQFALKLLQNNTDESNIFRNLENKASKLAAENACFLNFFSENNSILRTQRELVSAFQTQYPNINCKSLSHFTRHFLVKNRISYQKVKLTYEQKHLEKRQRCRVLFIQQLFKLREDQCHLVYFDETTFDLTSKPYHQYSFIGFKPQANIKMVPIFVRLLLIVSRKSIEAAVLTTESVTGDFVFNFLRRFIYEKQKSATYAYNALTIILDNSPKNRGNKIRTLANRGYVNLMYTTPCSPYTNFIESVFNILKRKLRLLTDYPFK